MIANATAAVTAVLFLGGTGTGYIPPADEPALERFAAPVVAEPFRVENHNYDGSPIARPQASAAELNRRIATIVADDPATPVVVIGLSKGAQVATAAQHADNAPEPGTVRFVLLGNPDNPRGLNTRAGLRPEYGEVRYDTEEIIGEYDFFADPPDTLNPVSWLNAAAGLVYVHNEYGSGSADDPLTRLDEAEVTVVDNLDADGNPNGTTTTTRFVPTPRLPLTRPLRDTITTLGGDDRVVDDLDAALRPIVDAGYDRRPSANGRSTSRMATPDTADDTSAAAATSAARGDRDNDPAPANDDDAGSEPADADAA